MKSRTTSEIRLSYHPKQRNTDRPQIKSAEDAYQILLDNWDKGKIEFVEELKVIFLNNSSRVLGIYTASSGGMRCTVADPKTIFIAALKSCASSFILVHNHPSGNLSPSESDRAITKKMKAAGILLDIVMLDHLIISSEGNYSFRDNGEL